MLANIILAVQMLSALGMVGLVLIQHGKGADMGAAFGSGGSGSLFGASGSANFLSRTTGVLASVFFVATLALAGSVILLFVMGFGINMDVQALRFAVLDHDQTSISRSYAQSLSGSRYFTERAPLASYDELDQRMRSGELSLALEIPPGFGRTVLAGQPAAIGAWFDGAMPQRGETVKGYVQAMHQLWLAQQARERLGIQLTSQVSLETRFRYNPDVKSLPAMVPAVIPLLLMLIPAMLTALGVVREKELGSIINLYVTPVTRSEFLIGKQLPYIVLAMLNFLLLTVLAIVLGGTDPFGGVGKIIHVFCALLVLQVIATGLSLAGVSLHFNLAVWGITLIFALAFKFFKNKWQAQRAMKLNQKKHRQLLATRGER